MSESTAVPEPSWDDVLVDVRATFSKDNPPTRARVAAYIFGKYGLHCDNGCASYGSESFEEEVIITPHGMPRRLRIEGGRGRETRISFAK